MNGFPAFDGLERWQSRVVRRMMALSFAAHGAVFLFGSSLSACFPPAEFSAPVMVELTGAPVSELPDEPPAPPLPAASPARPEPVRPPSPGSAPASLRPGSANSGSGPAASGRASRGALAASRWLDRLDAVRTDAPIARGEGRAGGIPVRHWANEGPVRPEDFPPAVASERTASFGRHVGELEARLRGSGRPGAGFGMETEASMMFGGTGDSAGEPIPAGIREMIRKRVRDRLPELEGEYADALRRKEDLRGRMVVRFRIDPSGKIESAESVEESLRDAAFVNAVLGKVRRWVFEPTAGRTVEVLYPFVFVPLS